MSCVTVDVAVLPYLGLLHSAGQVQDSTVSCLTVDVTVLPYVGLLHSSGQYSKLFDC